MLNVRSKKIFFFDIDNTLLSQIHKKIFPQTVKVIKKLSEDPNVILGIATGRNKKRLNILDDLLPLFKHLVLLNGSVVIINDQVILENYFDKNEVFEFIEKVKKKQMYIGMVGLHQEAVISGKDLFISDLFKDFFTQKKSILDNKFYLKNNVYQMWIVDKDINKINNFVDKHKKNFQFYYWNQHGVDVVTKGINKVSGIKQIKQKYPEHQLICVGDGHNDIDMLEYADIGIAMGNSKYQKLKDKANIIAPHIDEDKIYDFFKIHNLI